MSESRDEKIKKDLDFSHRLHKAVQKILLNYKPYEKVAKEYSLDNESLNFKISIFLRKKKYLEEKPKFEKAIADLVSNKKNLQNAAKEYKINEKELLIEYAKYKYLKDKTEYKYDKLSDMGGIFTFTEEFSLLERLHCWKKECECPCQICALKQLQSFIYDLALKNHKQYIPIWLKNKKAGSNWLYKFIIKYIEEISEFESFNNCKIQCQPSTSQSSSMLEPTLYAHMQRDTKLSHLFNKPSTNQSSSMLEPTLYAHMQGDTKLSHLSNVPLKSKTRRKRNKKKKHWVRLARQDSENFR